MALIADKMVTLEQRLSKSDLELRSQSDNQKHELRAKQQADAENKKLFQRLQESIAIQQQSMLQYVDRATKDIKEVQEQVEEVRERKINDLEVSKIIEAVKEEVSAVQEDARGPSALGEPNEKFFTQKEQPVAAPVAVPQAAAPVEK